MANMQILKIIKEKRRVLSIIGVLGASLLLVLFFVFYVVFQPYQITGNSMEPTIKDGDRLLIFRAGKIWSNIVDSDYVPEQGKIIIFQDPSQDFGQIKRIIGLPGERIVIANSVITIYNDEFPEGFELEAEWESALADFPADEPVTEHIVGDNEVFVLGDNRSILQSTDSRGSLGNVPVDNIKGVIP